MRIVATLTTLPDRYSLLQRTIESLVNQDVNIDVIYIGLPVKTRKGLVYPPLPVEILKYENVQIVPLPVDYGPICKLLGALVSEQDPQTYILSVDDDVIYPNNTVRTFVSYATKYPNDAICGSGVIFNGNLLTANVTANQEHLFCRTFGFVVPTEGRLIDILSGVGGVLYQRRFFPHVNNLYTELLHYCDDDINVLLNDDILISGYLSAHNYGIRIVNRYPGIVGQRNEGERLSGQHLTMLKSMSNCISYLKTQGLFQQNTHMNMNESIIYAVIFALLALFALGVLIIAFYMQL